MRSRLIAGAVAVALLVPAVAAGAAQGAQGDDTSRDAELMRLLAPQSGTSVAGSLQVRVEVARRATLKAWLNGRSLDAELLLAHRRRAAPDGDDIVEFDVGAGHGLRFGSNTLRIRADGGGSSQRITRRVRVRRRAPLAGAGESQTTTIRSAVELDAGASRSSRRDDLSYEWQLVRRPDGSSTELDDSQSPRPRLTPDRPGIYRLRLTVTERPRRRGDTSPGRGRRNVRNDSSNTRTAEETLTLVGTPNDPLVAVDTAVEQNNQVGMTLDGQFFPGPVTPVQVFMLDRATLETPPAVEGFNDMTKIAGWIDEQTTKTGFSSAIVILQTTTQGTVTAGTSNDFNAALTHLGATSAWSTGSKPPAPFVAIGVAGIPAGSATQSCAPSPPTTARKCAIDGYFSSPVTAAGVTTHYTFSSGDYVPFSTRTQEQPDGLTNIMAIGEKEIPGPVFVGSAGGYHVVAVDRYDLSVQVNKSFATGDPGDGRAQQLGMAEELEQLAHDETKLVLIASVGPSPVSFQSRDPAFFTRIMGAIRQIGGTPDVFARVGPSDTYSLIGAAGDIDRAAEASNVATPPGQDATVGTLHGMLQRNNSERYEPLATSTPKFAWPLFDAVFRPSQPWPHSDAPDYTKANAYIVDNILPSDLKQKPTHVRDFYTNTSAVTRWQDAPTTNLERLDYPEDAGFTEETFNALKDDFLGSDGSDGEFVRVDRTIKFLTSTAQKPLGNATLTADVNLKNITDAIEQAVKPPSGGRATADILSIIDAAVGLSDVSDGAGPVVTLLGGVFGIAADTTSSQTHGTRIGPAVEAEADALAEQLVEGKNALTDTMDMIAGAAVSDAGRLDAVDDITVNSGWGESTPSALINMLTTAANQEVARALVRVAWTVAGNPHPLGSLVWHTQPGDTDDAKDPEPLRDISKWRCKPDYGFGHIHPYGAYDSDAGRNTQYAAIRNWKDEDGEAVPQVSVTYIVNASWPGHSLGDKNKARQCMRHWLLATDLASTAVFTALFAAPPEKVDVGDDKMPNIGLYKPWFFVRNAHSRCWRTTGCAPVPEFLNPAPAWADGH